MTCNLSLLCNFVEKYLGTVHFGNDQFAPILGYGDLVQGNITIKRVYYVEGLNHNLFSVGQFCDVDLEGKKSSLDLDEIACMLGITIRKRILQELEGLNYSSNIGQNNESQSFFVYVEAKGVERRMCADDVGEIIRMNLEHQGGILLNGPSSSSSSSSSSLSWLFSCWTLTSSVVDWWRSDQLLDGLVDETICERKQSLEDLTFHEPLGSCRENSSPCAQVWSNKRHITSLATTSSSASVKLIDLPNSKAKSGLRMMLSCRSDL
ncbi:hypothetical protein Tco_1213279 [Tanacetum coccineum]